jgi:acyl-CoA synthetase (AMP-forming)/AMP-acid ligase II
VATIARSLHRGGVGRGDRVAIVLPSGSEMATAFLGVAASATAAPLNPAYRAEELEYYLADLLVKAIVVEPGSSSPAVEVARRLGVRIFELAPVRDGAAGQIELRAPGGGGAARDAGPALPHDTALLLHTSGTTSRPKVVPLSHRNLCASAASIRHGLALTVADRGLSIMPLFHIHGLVAGLLAPLSAGGQVVCPPGFNALRFFAWIAECRPTWYTAVPTMHQAILARAPHNASIIAASPFRFIRSSSATLPVRVLQGLERVFGAPVIEAYGMTEAAHQITSNPLPPGVRKPGSVGVAAGPEVAVMDHAGHLLPAGQAGEIVIQGRNVTVGYENNPRANTEAFTHGWFRTGDHGVLDADGYLTILRRLKEIINRGGEKISPREVDEILLEHPAVAQAVTFAVPHDSLGEDVAAAVVLRDGAGATEREIRDFVATHLADFKVPRKVLFVPELPRGATGKIQRIGLAKKLGLT